MEEASGLAWKHGRNKWPGKESRTEVRNLERKRKERFKDECCGKLLLWETLNLYQMSRINIHPNTIFIRIYA